MKRNELLEALEIVKPGLASKEVLEQSTSFAFLEGRVYTYNDEVSISTPVDKLELKLNGAIRADELYKLLGKIKTEDITIEILDKEVIIKGGRAKAGLPLQAEIKLPLEEITEAAKHKWQKLPKEFNEALKFTSLSCSKDNSKPVLTCLYIDNNKVESSDDYRATQYTLSKSLEKQVLIPCSSAQIAAQYEMTLFAQSENWVHFKNDKGTRIACRLAEGKFPSIEKILDVKGHEFTLPEGLATVLERAAIFTKQEYAKGYYLDEFVSVTVDDNWMVVKAKNEWGWFEEKIRTVYKGKSFAFGINPAFLQSISEQLKSCSINDQCIKFKGENWQHVIALQEV